MAKRYWCRNRHPSVIACLGRSHLLDYSATNGAIVTFTRSLSQQLAERGIRVNGVAPDPVWTPLIPSSSSADTIPQFGQGVPMGRAGQLEEMAPCYVFLTCEDSSYMTGKVMHPNGREVVNALGAGGLGELRSRSALSTRRLLKTP